MPAFVLIRVLQPGFFSRKDTKTPTWFAAVSLIVNIVLSLALFGPLKHVGIALATSISAWINVVLLALFLARRGHFTITPAEWKQQGPILALTLVMSGALWGFGHAARPGVRPRLFLPGPGPGAAGAVRVRRRALLRAGPPHPPAAARWVAPAIAAQAQPGLPQAAQLGDKPTAHSGTISMPFTPRVFSGIKPSGDLHLGNYLGAIRRFVPLQNSHETLYCVVDMHAITVWQEPEDLRRWTYEIAAAYIAAGLDPNRSIIFNQSQVVEHAELAWIFNCVARVGWMTRMTQFKDKAGAEGGENSEAVSLGLFAYPSLMAADILLYKATAVPVGDDQRQQPRADARYRQEVQPRFHVSRSKASARTRSSSRSPRRCRPARPCAVMSLKDGKKKMSKSDASDMSTIYMMDDADTIAKKIKRATTDADMLPTEAAGPRRPAGSREPRRHLCGARRQVGRRRARGVRQ